MTFSGIRDAVCALIVKDDAAILAKVTTNANFDIDTLGAFSSMMFATARMLIQELRIEGEVLGAYYDRDRIPPPCHGHHTKDRAGDTLQKVIREGSFGISGASPDASDDRLPGSRNLGGAYDQVGTRFTMVTFAILGRRRYRNDLRCASGAL